MTPAAPALDTLALLSPAEADEAAAEVMALRARWIARGTPPWFHSLTAASYIDLHDPAGAERYYRAAHADRALLHDSFGWLYDRVRRALRARLGDDVDYHPRFALPGFHVFLGEHVPTRPATSTHFDEQYRLLDWRADERPDLTRPISFTLPVRLPAAGGALSYWDLEPGDPRANGAGADRLAELADALPEHRHRYQTGVLTLHSGHLLHRIAPAASASPDDARITLQGHGIRCRTGWQLYW